MAFVTQMCPFNRVKKYFSSFPIVALLGNLFLFAKLLAVPAFWGLFRPSAARCFRCFFLVVFSPGVSVSCIFALVFGTHDRSPPTTSGAKARRLSQRSPTSPGEAAHQFGRCGGQVGGW